MGWFHFLAIMSIAEMHIDSKKISAGEHRIHSYVVKSGIANSYNNFSFSFSKKMHIAFHGGCASSQYYQYYLRVAFSNITNSVVICFPEESHCDWCGMMFDVAEYTLKCL